MFEKGQKSWKYALNWFLKFLIDYFLFVGPPVSGFNLCLHYGWIFDCSYHYFFRSLSTTLSERNVFSWIIFVSSLQSTTDSGWLSFFFLKICPMLRVIIGSYYSQYAAALKAHFFRILKCADAGRKCQCQNWSTKLVQKRRGVALKISQGGNA